MAMDREDYAVLRDSGLYLSKEAKFMYRYGNAFGVDAIAKVDELAKKFFELADRLNGNSYSVQYSWVMAMENIMDHVIEEEEVVSLCNLMEAKCIRAIELEPKKYGVLKIWAWSLEKILDSLVRFGFFSENKFMQLFEHFLSTFKRLSTVKNLVGNGSYTYQGLPLKSIMSFSLVEYSADIRRAARDLLEKLSMEAKNPIVRFKARKYFKDLVVIDKNSLEVSKSNQERVVSVIARLPLRAKVVWEKSNLKISDIESDFDVFMNCLHFVVDNETAKDDIFRKKKVVAQKAFKTFSLSDVKKVVKNCDPNTVFKKITELGSGGFGKVFLSEYIEGKSSTKVALKVLPGALERNAKFLNEIESMRKLNHPNIIKLFDVYHYDSQLWLAMEYCNGGSLMNLYKKVELTEREIAYIIRKICLGINHIHGQYLAHLDLKSSNILLGLDGSVKIADFGLIKEVVPYGNTLTGVSGTSYWMAPEVIQLKSYGQKADIWGIGCICLEMVRRSPPKREMGALRAIYDTATMGFNKLYMDICKNGKFSQMADFLKKTFQMDPMKRPTCAQLLDHPFLTEEEPTGDLINKIKYVFIDESLKDYGIF